MKWLLPLPKLPCRYAALLEPDASAPRIRSSARSKAPASCGVTT